tara:strand:- start:183 stop:926 length:744 start_codon:yes stop_codon:yes gene_type:complete
MSGHSKWATTKRHKAAIDAKRGKIFSIIGKELTLAARSGGGDPEANARLRSLVLKAKASNMPGDNIDRAIKKGTGELEGAIIEEMLYEGYGPGGVGLLIEVTTDNKNRSAGEVRSTLGKYGGNLATQGAVSFNFQRKGQFLIGSDKVGLDALMDIAIEAGAEDVLDNEDHFEVQTEVGDFDTISQALEDNKISPESSELVYLPLSTTPVDDKDTARKVLKLIEMIDELEDVKSVFSNFEIDDALLAE